MTAADQAPLRAEHLTLAYGERVIQRDLDFTVNRGDIFIVMGGSGCGKSTLLRHLIGLQRPAAGRVFYGAADYWAADPADRAAILRRIGVLYQGGALFSSMTLAENVAVPLETCTPLPPRDIRALAELKLALVGLTGFGDYYPSEISGGMRKRAGLARALALDPEILFFDEPSAGLDPVSAKRLDDLMLRLRDALGATLVVVTHELASLLSIGTNSVFLDAATRTQIATGAPRDLLADCPDPTVQAFLRRGELPPPPKTKETRP